MADGSLPLDLGHELVVDLFAGGGGASMGIGAAYREPDIAVNHNAIAVAVHRANHPNTKHFIEDVFDVDPITVTRGRPVGLLWMSPDCRHHSKAKGAAPRNKRIRGLAWIGVRWALDVVPRRIDLENVEEFVDWGPLDEDGHPIKDRKGETFRAFIAAMTTGLPADHPAMDEIIEFLGTDVHVPALVRGLGYQADWREIRACNKGAPTIRKRLLVKFSRTGKITWSPDSHSKDGAGGLKPWRTAAQCIDFTLPSRSIFERPRPIVRNTCRRVAKGLWRFVLATNTPYIVGGQAAFLTEHANASNQRVFAIGEPLRTQMAQVKGGHFSLVAAHLAPLRGTSESHLHGARIDAPAGTISAQGTHHALVQAQFLEQANGGFYDGDGRDAREPLSTICQSGANQRLVSAYLVKYYGNERDGVSLLEPMHTLPAKDRMGLVQVVKTRADILPPELLSKAKRCADFLREHLPEHFPEPVDMVLVGDYVLIDITLRMLVPAELARAQGFHAGYIIDRGLFETFPGSGQFEWRPISKTDQVKLIGNSVCPDMAEVETREDLADLINLYARAA